MKIVVNRPEASLSSNWRDRGKAEAREERMKDTVIGWIGLGKMGAPMCDHLIEAGYTVRVYDVNPHAANAFTAKGARACESLAVLAEQSHIVFSMVPDDAALIAVGSEVLSHLAPGKAFVDMSTVSPQASARVAELADDRDVDYVRAPVSGSTELAVKGLLTVFASGPARAHAALQPMFSKFAASTFHVGETEQARYMKLAINHIVGSTAALMGEALTLGRKGDIDWSVMLEVMEASVIASPLVKYKINSLKSRDFTPAFSASQMRKDMGLVASVGRDSGVHMPLAEQAYRYFEEYAECCPNNDFFGLVENVEKLSGLDPKTSS